MTDIEAKAKSTPPLKAAWFEDDEHAENELKAAQPSMSTSTPSPSKEKAAQRVARGVSQSELFVN